MRYLVSAAFLAVLNAAMWAVFFVPKSFPVQPDPKALALFGVLFSGLLLACLASASVGKEIPSDSARREAIALIAVSAALLSFGVIFGKLSAVPAVLVLICGSAALLIGLSAVQEVREKKGFEVTSHWGGLGGSIGGWRVSSGVTAILLALVFLGAAITVGIGMDNMSGTAVNGTSSPTTNEADDPETEDAGNIANNMGIAANDSITAVANVQGDVALNNAAAPAGIGEAPSSTPVDNPDAQ